jgi:hypothetical protein
MMCLPIGPGVKIEREWVHAGLNCAVTQTSYGAHRCGYVRVPPGHPLHGKEFSADNDRVDHLQAHGGVTFSEIEPCAHEDGVGWWFGFDCCHAYDARFDPDADLEKMEIETREMYRIMMRLPILREGHYWTEDEVAAECEQLAEQLAAVTA